jgi:hypothetical protein
MKLSSVFLLLALVAVAGCGKQEGVPEPSLLGSWVYIQKQATYYLPDGTVDFVGPVFTPLPSGSTVRVITADSLLTRIGLPTGGYLLVRGGYTRAGNVLNVADKNGAGGIHAYQMVIDELTEHRLQYHIDSYSPASTGGALRDREAQLYTR